MTEPERLGERVRQALAAGREEPDVGFEGRMREGADDKRQARRARRAAGLAVLLAGGIGVGLVVLDRPPATGERAKPATVSVPLAAGTAGDPLAPGEAAQALVELTDVEAALGASADWQGATAPIAPYAELIGEKTP